MEELAFTFVSCAVSAWMRERYTLHPFPPVAGRRPGAGLTKAGKDFCPLSAAALMTAGPESWWVAQ